MAVRSLGKVAVTTAGTVVRVTAGEAVPAARIGAQSVFFQQVPGNTGKVYIGLSSMVVSTFVGVLAVLPIPTVNILPGFSLSIMMAPAGFNIADFYLDSEVSGEGVLISWTEQ